MSEPLPGPPVTPLPEPTAEQDLSVDKGWWSFWTPITERAPTGPDFAQRPKPVLLPPDPRRMALLQGDPFPFAGPASRGRMWFSGRLPQWVSPNYYAKPFDRKGEVCLTFYERWYEALVYRVPTNYVLRLNGMSFQTPCLAAGEIFEVSVYRNSLLMTRFEEIVANGTAANPAERLAFSGHVRPVPVPLVIDSNDTLRVEVRARGTYPFEKTENDQICCTFGAYAQGWLGDTMRSTQTGDRTSDAPVHEPALVLPEGPSEGLRDLLEWVWRVGYPGIPYPDFRQRLQRDAGIPVEDNRLTWAALFAAFAAVI